MSKRRDQHPDDSLEAWQEWTSHSPGSWRSSGRVPPIGRFGRRPTRAGLVLVAIGSAILVLALGLLGVTMVIGREAMTGGQGWSLPIAPVVIGVLLISVGWRLAHPSGNRRVAAGHRRRGRGTATIRQKRAR